MLVSQKKLPVVALGSVSVLSIAVFGACSSSSSGGSPGGSDSSTSSSSGSSSGGTCNPDSCESITQGGCGLTTDAGIDAAVSSCAAPGMATAGAADMHCATGGADGGAQAQEVSAASCCAGADAGTGDDGGDEGCGYGATMYGQEGDDDDCKYHVTWTSTPICEGSAGAQFVVTAVYKTRFGAGGAPLPLTGANTMTETFTTTPGDADAATYCDDLSTHPGPTNPNANHLTEGPPGTYTGNVAFDAPGAWTVRFHFNEECADVSGDSPHGHAAFHVTVP